MKRAIAILVLAAVVLAAFTLGITNLDRARQAEGQQQLEQAVRRTAVACYAAEGAYPPDIRYLQDHYGLQFDRDRYIIHYQLLASNLMPDITVLERK